MPASLGPATTVGERLRTLDELLSDGLITDAEYAERRAAVLAEV
jgi:hypothetical protein